MSDPLILVVTSRPDTHVHQVGRHLSDKGIDWIRLNTEDLYTNTVLDVSPPQGLGCVWIKDSQRSFEIGDVSAVWYRKPETPSISHLAPIEDHERRFFEAESYENLLSLYSVLQAPPWINNPLTTRLAFRRFHQLHTARKVGMRTVRSIFTNDEDAVFRFAEQVGGPLALKSLSAVSVVSAVDGETMDQYGVLTRTIDQGDLKSLRSSIAALPTFIQEYVPKKFDLRVVVVGRRLFACRIHSQVDDLTKKDFRIATKALEHELVDLPTHLEAMIYSFMDVLGIDFGCFDFLEVEEGDPYFLECNPNGQWLWIQERTGAPIAEAIADHLCELAGAGRS